MLSKKSVNSNLRSTPYDLDKEQSLQTSVYPSTEQDNAYVADLLAGRVVTVGTLHSRALHVVGTNTLVSGGLCGARLRQKRKYCAHTQGQSH